MRLLKILDRTINESGIFASRIEIEHYRGSIFDFENGITSQCVIHTKKDITGANDKLGLFISLLGDFAGISVCLKGTRGSFVKLEVTYQE